MSNTCEVHALRVLKASDYSKLYGILFIRKRINLYLGRSDDLRSAEGRLLPSGRKKISLKIYQEFLYFYQELENERIYFVVNPERINIYWSV